MSEPITVPVIKYRAIDGEIFDKKEDADLHEKLLSGEVKRCPQCHGTKFIQHSRYTSTCDTCSGKGYLEKVETWK